MPAASIERFLPSARLPRISRAGLRRLVVRLVVVVAVVYAVWLAFRAFVTIRTSLLWFDSIHAGSVYGTMLRAQVLLFCVFGGLTAAAVAAMLVYVVRTRPKFRPHPERQKWRARFLRYEKRVRVWLIVLVSGYLGIQAGSVAESRWQTYLLWRHATPWGQQDAQFHRDLSYYIEVMPFHRMVVNQLLSLTVTLGIVTLITSYLYGALRIRGRGPRMTPAFKAQLSLLLGIWLLLRAASFWLGRYALTSTNHGPVTGLSYTDMHALLPARTILTVVAVLCALLLFANLWLRRLRYAVLGVAVLWVAGLVLGGLWPSLVQRYREQPSAASLDRTTIERNQAATMAAFGLSGKVTTEDYGDQEPLRGTALAAQSQRTAQVRLLDPNRLSPTFNFKQALASYYGFKSTLDIDHYEVGGQDRDLAVAVRELNLGGIPRGSWTNKHLVYTHGYGVVAAPTDSLSRKTKTPIFFNGGIPPKDKIQVTQPRIYFGQGSSAYSVVGEPAGSTRNMEFDYPSGNGSARSAHTTYTGSGGVPIGSWFDRLMYAVQLHDPNLFFSSEINSGSRLLAVRNPRTRVAQVAPWLTLDGDVYPAIVGGKVYWVVDGYTSTNNYPASETVNLRSATTNSLTRSGSTVTQPNTNINYLHNSVKAVVDAYTGQVTLYAWNQESQPDPLLAAWERVFPGLVKPQSDIPADLLSHLRYPQDLFNVQRSLLTSYHVTDPGDFYNGSDFWRIPNDPTVSANNSINSGSSGGSSPTIPSVYMSMSATGDGAASYALSTPMVTLNSRNLAGFLTVDAAPGPDYGKFTLLQFAAGASVESPSQIQNDIESDTKISKALSLQRQGNSKVVLGNLLTIPLGGKMLYVEPVYTRARNGTSFPVLAHVIAVYGNGQPAFESTLDKALSVALANDAKRSR